MNDLRNRLTNLNNWFYFGSLSLFLLMLGTTNNPLAKHFQLSFVNLSYSKNATILGAVAMNLAFVIVLLVAVHYAKIFQGQRIFHVPSFLSILEMIGVMIVVTFAIIAVSIWIYIHTSEGEIFAFVAQVNADTFASTYWIYTFLHSVKILGFQLLYCASWIFLHQVFVAACQKDTFIYRTLFTLIIELLIFVVLKVSSNDATLVEYLVIHIFSLFNFQHRRNYWTSTIIVLWAEWLTFAIMLLPLLNAD